MNVVVNFGDNMSRSARKIRSLDSLLIAVCWMLLLISTTKCIESTDSLSQTTETVSIVNMQDITGATSSTTTTPTNTTTTLAEGSLSSESSVDSTMGSTGKSFTLTSDVTVTRGDGSSPETVAMANATPEATVTVETSVAGMIPTGDESTTIPPATAATKDLSGEGIGELTLLGVTATSSETGETVPASTIPPAIIPGASPKDTTGTGTEEAVTPLISTAATRGTSLEDSTKVETLTTTENTRETSSPLTPVAVERLSSDSTNEWTADTSTERATTTTEQQYSSSQPNSRQTEFTQFSTTTTENLTTADGKGDLLSETGGTKETGTTGYSHSVPTTVTAAAAESSTRNDDNSTWNQGEKTQTDDYSTSFVTNLSELSTTTENATEFSGWTTNSPNGTTSDYPGKEVVSGSQFTADDYPSTSSSSSSSMEQHSMENGTTGTWHLDSSTGPAKDVNQTFEKDSLGTALTSEIQQTVTTATDPEFSASTTVNGSMGTDEYPGQSTGRMISTDRYPGAGTGSTIDHQSRNSTTKGIEMTSSSAGSPYNEPSSSVKKDGLSGGEIAAIVIFSVIGGVTLIVGVIVYVIMRRRGTRSGYNITDNYEMSS